MFKDFLFRTLNLFIPKKKRSIYINLGRSSDNNCHDILNYSGDNSLSFLNYFLKRKFKNKVYVYIDYFDDSRMPAYIPVIKAAKENNIILVLIKSYRMEKGAKRIRQLLHHYFCLFNSRLWFIGTGDSYLYGKLKTQTIINTNYFISCKNDFIKNKNYRWNYIDSFLTTSLLHSTVSAAQTGVRFDNCIELGFPRNDTLFNSNKKELIYKWIKDQIGYCPKKIIVYAPTYRDYELKEVDKAERYLFGYEIAGLKDFLKENQVCIICKLHNLMRNKVINYLDFVIDFKICYDFSFYDLLSYTDCLITDYSSLGYDYLLLNKPIIYNLYDFEKYKVDRGLSYDPYDFFCPGPIVDNESSFLKEMKNIIDGIDNYRKKREELIPVFHKNIDNQSTSRLFNYIVETFNFKLDCYERNK